MAGIPHWSLQKTENSCSVAVFDAANMEAFQFVTLTDPNDIKKKHHQNTIRAHAIRTTLKKTRDKAAKASNNFVKAEIDSRYGRVKKKPNETGILPVTRPPSASRVDPFDCLPASPERLRVLMRGSMFSSSLLKSNIDAS